MEKKVLVSHTPQGKTHVFAARASRSRVAGQEMDEIKQLLAPDLGIPSPIPGGQGQENPRLAFISGD
jgi:hypothetical protein